MTFDSGGQGMKACDGVHEATVTQGTLAPDSGADRAHDTYGVSTKYLHSITGSNAVDQAQQPRAAVKFVPVAPGTLEAAKRAYTTRRCNLDETRYLVSAGIAPRAGDLVLARVTEVGQHSGLHALSGRRATLFVGDEIIVAYGNRYAPDQFEAVVPRDLGPCQLAAGGGVAARVLASHPKMRKPTQLAPVGLLADEHGRVLNLERYAIPRVSGRPRRPVTMAVVGTSMNSGKTTTAAHLVRGLRAAGLVVSAAKVTGTGAGGDPWLMRDAGAAQVLDFTDAGHASTYKLPLETLCDCIDRVLDHLSECGTEVAVLEIADGLFQRETSALLEMPNAADYFDLLIFAAQDAMGATAGVDWLEHRGLPVAAVSGIVTASPLAAREASRAVSLPMLKLSDLGDAGTAGGLFAQARQAREALQANRNEKAA